MLELCLSAHDDLDSLQFSLAQHRERVPEERTLKRLRDGAFALQVVQPSFPSLCTTPKPAVQHGTAPLTAHAIHGSRGNFSHQQPCQI